LQISGLARVRTFDSLCKRMGTEFGLCRRVPVHGRRSMSAGCRWLGGLGSTPTRQRRVGRASNYGIGRRGSRPSKGINDGGSGSTPTNFGRRGSRPSKGNEIDAWAQHSKTAWPIPHQGRRIRPGAQSTTPRGWLCRHAPSRFKSCFSALSRARLRGTTARARPRAQVHECRMPNGLEGRVQPRPITGFPIGHT